MAFFGAYSSKISPCSLLSVSVFASNSRIFKAYFSFKYSDIKRLFKNNKVSIGRHSGYQQYLHIITSDNEFEILVYSTKLLDEEFKDITDYLINKNPNIKLDK